MEETKIFVVITVLSTVLIGLAVYLFWKKKLKILKTKHEEDPYIYTGICSCRSWRDY